MINIEYYYIKNPRISKFFSFHVVFFFWVGMGVGGVSSFFFSNSFQLEFL